MYLSIYLSIHPFIYLSILSLSICRSFLILTYLVLSYFILSYLTHFFILSHLSLYLSIYLSIDLIYLFILSNLPSNLSVYSFNLSVYLRVSICKLENEAILQHFVPMCFAIFQSTCRKYCACHEKLIPGHTKYCTYHAKSF